MEVCRVANMLYKSAEAVLIAFLLLFLPTSVAFAESATEISVQWYEPKVVPTTAPGINKVTLIGKTDPYVVVQVSSENIVIRSEEHTSELQSH